VRRKVIDPFVLFFWTYFVKKIVSFRKYDAKEIPFIFFAFNILQAEGYLNAEKGRKMPGSF
jgi:hypothetical protein